MTSGGSPEGLAAGHDDQAGKADLRRQGCAQRSGRDHVAVAEATIRVDNGNRKVLCKCRILQSVVHDDDAILRGACFDRIGASPPVPRDDGGRVTCEQKRLVSDFIRAVRSGFDA